MNFKELLIQAKSGDKDAEESILALYKPLLIKESILDGTFDEDLYQELCITLLNCIRKFII
ncbi:helix-turn-helix domain-containing protein [Pseudoflavonifractor sp. 60]|uniref:helix-turn-helix domain-containing protein n=1 Tax=Pseudoflavonifractor sp. 60 TaxID=2304576 RepID=UPI00136D7569|nr:helix-turn-helix domain-containing protein [Pseudoflavonifractor sp. 60]NBI69053.1 helix-turn-helix domain-containing protein [Pseudoflavonifractor sp. 60]